MEVPLLSRRLSSPRAATAIALAAVIAAAVAVTPSLAGSFLTNRQAAGIYLKKQAAAHLFVAKAAAPFTPVSSIAAGNAIFGPVSVTTAGDIPAAFTSFAMKGTGPAVITFSGQATCTAPTPTAELACPINILVDGQTAAKVNFAPATASSPSPAPVVHSVTQTTVLGKGGHTVQIQYAGASKVSFELKGWNLAVQGYPQNPETAAGAKGPAKK